MRWLVLSDIHFQFENCDTEIARQKLIKVISEEAKKEEISFICELPEKLTLDGFLV